MYEYEYVPFKHLCAHSTPFLFLHSVRITAWPLAEPPPMTKDAFSDLARSLPRGELLRTPTPPLPSFCSGLNCGTSRGGGGEKGCWWEKGEGGQKKDHPFCSLPTLFPFFPLLFSQGCFCIDNVVALGVEDLRRGDTQRPRKLQRWREGEWDGKESNGFSCPPSRFLPLHFLSPHPSLLLGSEESEWWNVLGVNGNNHFPSLLLLDRRRRRRRRHACIMGRPPPFPSERRRER